ncbi:2,3-oxidosqualene cyclase [Corallococcus praedator]|uniref:2,3-oxidosqualene cyclase n=2 Tax=Corallococcus TaxID=83461 RepID=A0ABX9Q7A7_9BACT|nr:2,3-oxidosqualene cyclase [Corallococcus praedator]RKH20261.1 2,3-oxidosqualene cyclase [Corallococcus sp. CA031C]RKH92532.1 2,3-oxidosqualene cyclase [Corallococcus praedator]
MQRARDVLARTQEADGSWKGDYGGPLFLTPVYVAGLYVMGRAPDARTREGMLAHLRAHQNDDGGWGLDVESRSLVFTTVLNYVAQRLMGVDATDPDLVRARAWFLPRGGPLGSGSWGKFVLALLGLYDYDGLTPIPPEPWLLPRWLPFHPSRLWCHCRMVYLPMGWLYGRRARAVETPLLAQVRRELYPQSYAAVDWKEARNRVAASDAYTPRSGWLRAVNRALGLYERVHPKRLRARALEECLALIRGEDEATHHLCIGPINKVLNTVVWHLARPDGPEVRAHLERLPDYLQHSADGTKVNGYNSSQLWDTAFAVQALVASGQAAGARDTLERAGRFLEAEQVLEDSHQAARHHRHPSRGGWPFSTRAHGWPISDCTAEGLKACLLLEPLGLNRVPRERLAQAVEFILSLQNRDGGWATYEQQRGPRWLERFNPSDVFAGIMVDASYVECTSACVQALVAWRKARPEAPVGRAIARGVDFLRRTQRPDGGWEGSWGVCFSYGTWFAVTGLVAGGLKPGDPVLRRASAFLKAHQREDGSWSETLQSCRERRWVEGPMGHAVTTSWALMALAATGDGESEAARRGVAWLRARQGADGRWPPEPLAGVFNRTCAIHYDTYLRIFPPWALSRWGNLMS